jgi:hypothetical protein
LSFAMNRPYNRCGWSPEQAVPKGAKGEFCQLLSRYGKEDLRDFRTK